MKAEENNHNSEKFINFRLIFYILNLMKQSNFENTIKLIE